MGTACLFKNKSCPHSRGEYNIYSSFQRHEPECLPQQIAVPFLESKNGKDILFLQKELFTSFEYYLTGGILGVGGGLECFDVVLMSPLIICKICFDCNTL
uniref:Uncharacterized protein n=1 Tax=Strigops habroptila TaxID=2489341 RepID=A0A672U905_STRHB